MSGGAVHRAHRRHQGVSQLPPLHPQVRAGRALALRPARGLLDAGAELEKERLGERRLAEGRSRARLGTLAIRPFVVSQPVLSLSKETMNGSSPQNLGNFQQALAVPVGDRLV